MTCEHLKERLPDYWAHTLGPVERQAIDEHLAGCAACRDEAGALGETWDALGDLPEELPSPAVRQRFDAMLDTWRDAHRQASAGAAVVAVQPGRRRGWAPGSWQPAWQLAAAMLLVAAGAVLGRGPATFGRQAEEMAELRGELHGMRQMVALSMLQQQSAAGRLQGVTWSHDLAAPGREVLDALLDTLARDPNVNVRLAAVDALQQFAQQGGVRDGLVEALGTQESPLVEISLIDAMVELRERRALDKLRVLASDAKANAAVRARAAWGVQKLTQA